MISKAYISGSLGKAIFKQGKKWFVLEDETSDIPRAWHPLEGNDLSLAETEIIALPARTTLLDIRRSLALETRKKEALTLALQLMDESIEDGTLKKEIALLLGELTSQKEIFEFVENRLLTTPVAATFNPLPASEICRSLKLDELVTTYEFLVSNGNVVDTFYTVWTKVGSKFFNIVQLDQAWSLLTNQGIAKKFVESLVCRVESRWNMVVQNAILFFHKYGFASCDKIFAEMKTELEAFFRVNIQKDSFPNESGGEPGRLITQISKIGSVGLKKSSIERPADCWFVGIGIDKYQFWAPLQNAVSDVQRIAQLLSEKYNFIVKPENLLFDQLATRSSIFSIFRRLAEDESIKPNDRIFIFFAGHAFRDETSKSSYWIPFDADKDSKKQWLPNQTIKESICQISCKHTLLIVDSCFSGTLFHKNQSHYSHYSYHEAADVVKKPGWEVENSSFTTAVLATLMENFSPFDVAKLADQLRLKLTGQQPFQCELQEEFIEQEESNDYREFFTLTSFIE